MPALRIWFAVLAVAAAFAVPVVPAVVLAGAAAAAVSPGTSSQAAAAASDDDWPMFHHDAVHTGLSGDTTFSTANVAGTTSQWETNTGNASYASPAVVNGAALGKRVVYVGNQAGQFAAYDAGNGARLWSFKAGAAIASSAAVDNGIVYFGASDKYFYALDAATGALVCKVSTGGVMVSSPVVADPDGGGKVVYIGDNGLSGNDDGGHLWAINAVDPNAAADCSIKWGFSGYGSPPGSQPLAGTWSPPAFATTAAGQPLVVFGGSSPDNSAYAVDARTGALVWRFQTITDARDEDVGAGPTISAPGVNGFADGVAYIHGKDRMVFALNLRTGTLIWQYSYKDVAGGGRSDPALVGNRLVFGYGQGLIALDATTGAQLWRSGAVGAPTSEVISSPAVTGPVGSEVAFVGDTAGTVYAFDPATGARRWTSPAGTLVYGSPAVSGGRVFLTSNNGLLYAYGLGGGVSAPPDTTVTGPARNATLPAASTVTVTGSASDDIGVSDVRVAVRDQNAARWWNAAIGTWQQNFIDNPAALTAAGARGTNWTFTFPVAAAGGVFLVQASAIDTDRQSDPTAATTNFVVSSSGNPPDTTITSPSNNAVIPFPNGRAAFPINVSGQATDSGGAHPGIASVNVVVENLQHSEFWCGPAGCPDGVCGTVPWSATFTVVHADLANPGATSTAWTMTFQTYDHPHDYSITAWAIDNDGEKDITHARVAKVCVRDPGTGC